MPYYLRHYFAPDFSHRDVRPAPMADGTVDAHYLNYVQNVVAGQVLADLESLTDQQAEAILHPVPDQEENGDIPNFDLKQTEYDTRYIYQKRVFPLGPNCKPDPENPNRILAAVNGFCFYHNGLITVKRLLNVRRDMNFHTGNILFSGDVVVHGDVYPGFSLWGNTVLIKGRVDGGNVTARGRIDCQAGVKGAPTALVDAGGTVRLSFCEGARIKTKGNLIIDGNCLHSNLYVGGSLIVKGRLQGGHVHANGLVYVKEQLGGGQSANTIINLGYDPFLSLRLEELIDIITEQTKKVRYYEGRSLMNKLYEQQCAPLLELARIKLAQARESREKMARSFREEERKANRCRIVVPGTVHPGVEINIGQAHTKLVDEYRDVFFYLVDGDIVQGSPAVSKHCATGPCPSTDSQDCAES